MVAKRSTEPKTIPQKSPNTAPHSQLVDAQPSAPKRSRALPKWLVIVLLVFILPVGLVFLWRQTNWTKRAKQITTAVATVAWVLIITLSVIFAPPSVTATSPLADVTDASYTLAGTVTPAGSLITVNGHKATELNGKYTYDATLQEGDNNLDVVATSGSKQTRTVFKIHRYTQVEITARQKAAAQKKAAASAKQKALAVQAAAKRAAAANVAAQKAAAAAAASKAKADTAAKKKAAAAAAAQAKAAAAAKAKSDAAAAAKAKSDAAAAQAAAAAAAKQPKVVLDVTGSGIKQTQAFTTKSSWAISYAFDCSNFGSQGNFQIYLHNTDGSYNYGAGPNELAGSGSDVDYYYNDAGGHYLTVNSECSWHVIVKS